MLSWKSLPRGRNRPTPLKRRRRELADPHFARIRLNEKDGKNEHPLPYRSYSAYLRERYNGKVQRIALDAGFGCPHRQERRGAGGCVYCNPAGSGTSASDLGLSIREQMSRGVDRLSKQGIDQYIAYFQAFCGTDGDAKTLEQLYADAISFPGVKGLSVGTRPDMLPEDKLDILSRIAHSRDAIDGWEVWVELGLQSAHDVTLNRINRGHDVACFDDAVARAHDVGLKVAAHVILGLPGEDRAMMMATADHLNALPVSGVKLHHLFVEKDTELAKMHADGVVETLDAETYMDLCIEFLRRLDDRMVIMRLMGKAKSDHLIAPAWGIPTGIWSQRLQKEMIRRQCRQGDLFKR